MSNCIIKTICFIIFTDKPNFCRYEGDKVHCYSVSETPDSWEAANTECTNLADLETTGEATFVQGHLAGDNLWIGAKYHFGEGGWRWVGSSHEEVNFGESIKLSFI